PEPVERQKYGGRVGGAAAQAAADRQPLLECDIGAESAACLVLEQPRGPQAQVVLAEHAGEPERAVLAPRDAHAIGAVDQPENRLQIVIAVGAAAEDVQKEIELPGRRKL